MKQRCNLLINQVFFKKIQSAILSILEKPNGISRQRRAKQDGASRQLIHAAIDMSGASPVVHTVGTSITLATPSTFGERLAWEGHALHTPSRD